MATYCKKVEFEKFHAFLILTAGRFTKHGLELAKKIRSSKKKFFLIRTKIDENVRAEKRKKSFNEEAMLQKIRSDCSENLGDLLSDVRDIFLISNHERDKWDFARLLQAVLNALPTYQRETLVLSLGNAVTKDILQKKVQVLRGRIWTVASLSAAAACFPIPSLNIAVDIGLILNEFAFYRSQLGLPAVGSDDFVKLHSSTQAQVRKISMTTSGQAAVFISTYAVATFPFEQVLRVIPVVSSPFAYKATYAALEKCLKTVENTALLILKEAAIKANEELD